VVASVRAARDAVLGYQAAYLAEAEPDAALIRLWAAVEARVIGSLPQAHAYTPHMHMHMHMHMHSIHTA
jgi:hypothetical protein